jgi:hypothetical protein
MYGTVVPWSVVVSATCASAGGDAVSYGLNVCETASM